MFSKLEQNRMYIDLIHGRKFNNAQRESVKKAINAGLNISQLKQIAKEHYNSEHIDEFVHFFKTAEYKDNKNLYKFFTDESIDVQVLRQINKALDDKMIEKDILQFAQPYIYSASQMNELRLFLKQNKYTQEYHTFIFDKDKSDEAMKAIREACNMEIPFDEIESFDCYSQLYPSMINAVMNGILPTEVHMILEVTDEKRIFDAVVGGLSLGLDDDEIKTCLSGDDRHLDFYLRLMGEIHDELFMNKVMSIKELPRRQILEQFKNEDTFFKYLIHIHEGNQMNMEDQLSIFQSDCGNFDEKKLLTDRSYLDSFVKNIIDDDKKLRKLSLKVFLLKDISEKYEVTNYHPDAASMINVLEDIYIQRFGDLMQQVEQMDYFLDRYNQIYDLLEEHADTVKQGEGFITFRLNNQFEIMLKEYRDYYDVEKVIIRYDKDKVCEISNSDLNEMAKNNRRVRMNDRGEVPRRFKEGRDI